MNRVFVIDTNKQPLGPCTPARARRLLTSRKAAVWRREPFTIILKRAVELDAQPPIQFKADPGSKTTGLALVGEFPKQGRIVLWAANLAHRGQAIKNGLESRASLRRGRRGRKTRYRAARFDNRRRRPDGWLPPSLQSRVDNVTAWLKKLVVRAPVSECHVETVRFDMQKLVNPEISGVEYQQGTLAGYEVREYLLEKWNRTCAYCGKRDTRLEIDHIHSGSTGGSDRVSNLTLACHPCNQRKNNIPVETFIKDPAKLAKLKAQAQAPLKDATAVNAIRYVIGNAIRAFGLPTSFWSGGRTKFNRTRQGYAKDHWLDAVCVGESGATVKIPAGLTALAIKATGRGTRQVVKTDRYGFPRNRAGRIKRVNGFQTGDLVKLQQSRGKYAGEHVGRLAGIRADGRLDIAASLGKITAAFTQYLLLQRVDGYAYAH
jgi:RRXRR protein/HNH endonuclease